MNVPAKWKDKHKIKTIKFIPSIILYFCFSLKERVKPHKNESMLTLKEVKRINKTVSEVKAEMEQPDYASFVEGELFYQKPSFAIALGAVIGGLVAVAVIVTLIKRIAVNPYDSDEPEFYSPVE